MDRDPFPWETEGGDVDDITEFRGHLTEHPLSISLPTTLEQYCLSGWFT